MLVSAKNTMAVRNSDGYVDTYQSIKWIEGISCDVEIDTIEKRDYSCSIAGVGLHNDFSRLCLSQTSPFFDKSDGKDDL